MRKIHVYPEASPKRYFVSRADSGCSRKRQSRRTRSYRTETGDARRNRKPVGPVSVRTQKRWPGCACASGPVCYFKLTGHGLPCPVRRLLFMNDCGVLGLADAMAGRTGFALARGRDAGLERAACHLDQAIVRGHVAQCRR